ncbi:MAG: MMPL family transporter, partial [Clostridia bacterium]|nr:MMPL family transporter [Clostridia bacterium]
VDANVIIFERMKEEFKLGKTLRASLDAGFNRALISIIDSNVTTIIAAGVLYFLGSGPIKGFAITLGVGILVSMFTAIIVTKFLLKAMIDMNIKNKFLYGAPLKGGNNNA